MSTTKDLNDIALKYITAQAHLNRMIDENKKLVKQNAVMAKVNKSLYKANKKKLHKADVLSLLRDLRSELKDDLRALVAEM